MAAALILSGALWSFAAAAGPSVQWKAPPSCPDVAQGLSMIETNLGAPLGTIEANANFAVVLEEQDARWLARIDIGSGDAGSSRALPLVDNCLEASEAAALVVAIALDPASAPAPEPEHEPESRLIPEPVPDPQQARDPDDAPIVQEERKGQPEPEPEPEPAPPVAPPTLEEPLTIGGHLGIAGGLRYGSLDRALGVLSLRGGLLFRRARVSLEAVVAPRRVVEIGDIAQVQFLQWSVAAGGCGRVPIAATVALEPCGALEAGQTISTSSGLEGGGRHSPTSVAVRVGPHLTWLFSRRIGLWSGAEAQIPLTRPTFTAGGAGRVARVLPGGLHAFAGLEIRLGNAP